MKLYSEPFAPTGNMGGNGVQRLLGGYRLDFWPVFVRETIQNSWDAAKSDRESPVAYSLDLKSYSKEGWKTVWKETLAESAPIDSDSDSSDGQGSQWRNLTSAGPKTLLLVADRDTTGMGGPAQASTLMSAVKRDFADFVFNIGIPPDTEAGGGLFGYGKSILYNASLASTILMHTHCVDEHGELDSRLISIGLGSPQENPQEGTLLTGRHWWGDTDSYDTVGPVRGEEADRIAGLIGLPNFESAETGTTVAVVAPDLGEQGPREFMEALQKACLWHCWPKVLDTGNGPDMTFSFAVDGEQLPTLEPDDIDRLKPFCDAFRKLQKGPSEDNVHRIRSLRPKKDIGNFGLELFPFSAGADDTPMRPFEGPTHHVAVMRTPNLVVRYVPFSEHPLPNMEWAGVFKVLPKMDREFAGYEPPAHDEWLMTPPGSVSYGRNFWRISRTRIEELVADEVDSSLSGVSGASDSFGLLSDELGNLFMEGGGTGLGGGRGSRTGRGGRGGVRGPGIEWGEPNLVDSDGLVIHEFPFTVDHVPGSEGTTVRATVGVRVAGGDREGEPPPGLLSPTIRSFRAPSGEEYNKDQVEITMGEPEGEWVVVVEAPKECVIVFDLQAKIRENEDDG